MRTEYSLPCSLQRLKLCALDIILDKVGRKLQSVDGYEPHIRLLMLIGAGGRERGITVTRCGKFSAAIAVPYRGIDGLYLGALDCLAEPYELLEILRVGLYRHYFLELGEICDCLLGGVTVVSAGVNIGSDGSCRKLGVKLILIGICI